MANNRQKYNWIDNNYPQYPVWRRYDFRVLAIVQEIIDAENSIENLRTIYDESTVAQVMDFWLRDRIIELRRRLESIEVAKPRNLHYIAWLENIANREDIIERIEQKIEQRRNH